MVRGDLTIKTYRRLGKKRCLKGKHVYEHERICVPIPSRLHGNVKPFLNQCLKIDVTSENDSARAIPTHFLLIELRINR